MALKRALPRRQAAGFTLIEVTVALIVMIGMAVVGVTMMQDANRRQEAAATGDWLRVVAGAAKSYEKSNAAALQADAGAATPATRTAAQLSSLLPPGFSAKSPQGHTFTVRWIEPTAGKLQGLVVLQGGDELSGMSLLHVAGQAGGGAGYVDPQNIGQGRGARGTWTIPLSSWGGSPGIGKPLYALFYDAEAESATNDYLNRTAVAGKPELNRMSTAIDMASNNVNNAGDISAANVKASQGVTANAISIGNAAFNAHSYPYETIQVRNGLTLRLAYGSQDRLTIGGDGWNRFTGHTSTTGELRAGGAVRGDDVVASNTVQSSEMYAAGWFRSRGNGGWYSERYGGGWHMTDSSWIRAYGGKNVYTSGQLRGGTVRAQGRLTADEFIDLNGVATPGAGCSPSGLLGRTSAGVILSCVSGRWREPGGFSVSNYITGTWQPPYRGAGNARIADSSWEFCSLAGLMDMGNGEGFQIQRSSTGWIISGWRSTWNTKAVWMCIK